MTKPQTFAQKAQTRALRTFDHDLASIREGYCGGHFSADAAVVEFRAACTEAGRRLAVVEAGAA